MKIKASLCNSCNQTIVPPRETCPYCGNTTGDMRPLLLDNKGVVISHTTLNMPPIGSSSPVHLALVRMERDTVILCLAETEDEVHINSKVEITLDKESRFQYRVLK